MRWHSGKFNFPLDTANNLAMVPTNQPTTLKINTKNSKINTGNPKVNTGIPKVNTINPKVNTKTQR